MKTRGKNGKYIRTGIHTIICGFCKKIVTIRESAIKRGAKYCSIKCYRSVPRFSKGICPICGTEFKKRRLAQVYCSNKCRAWKGGKRKSTRGYTRIYNPSHPFADTMGYVFEHRLIMEKHIGRYLTRKEVVHHINRNTSDNRIENLMYFENNIAHLNYHKNH